MVKGISKQVILVKPGDDALFEQAIFIVRDGVREISEKELLLQAREAANDNFRQTGRWRAAAAFCGGSGFVGLLWILFSIL